MEGEKNHNHYEEDHAFVLEQADILLNQWKERPYDRISDNDYKIGISEERQRNKYRHAWFDAIGELVAIIDEQGLGSIGERQKIKNVITALNFQVGAQRAHGTPSEFVAMGDQLLRHIVDMLQQ